MLGFAKKSNVRQLGGAGYYLHNFHVLTMPKADPSENDFINVASLGVSNIMSVQDKVVLVTGISPFK